jgi:murein DD-endopeptidase MepM/ murein hydrolase activator NlpD
MFGFLLSIVLFFTACASNKNTAQDTQPTTEPETQILAPSETESEFTGNPILDEADAGNSEIAANDVTAADSDIEGPDGESEMSQDEADAELAADMAEGDSASLETLPKLTLDMTTAFVPTASRRISAPYGIRTYRMHRGVDMGLCHGEDRTIVAAFTGVVTKVRNQGRRKGYGKYVILDHGNGLTTLYAHLASWQVNVGDTLQAGDTIGVGGNTGRSFGAHLHFEMKYHGNYIDPSTIFDFEQGTFRNALIVIEPNEMLAIEEGYQKELSKHRYYKVRRGDCLGKIARKYGISVTRLKQLNGIKGNTIRPGQVLRCS